MNNTPTRYHQSVPVDSTDKSRSGHWHRYCFMLSVALLLILPYLSSATQRVSFNPEKAEAIILLENGRKKPLDTYARNKLLQFSGKRRVKGKSALRWMADLLFDPARCDFDKVFLINNPGFAKTLGIAPERRRRYSFAALSSAGEKIQNYYNQAAKTAAENQTEFDREIIRTYRNLIEYRTLASTTQFLQPDMGYYLPSIDSAISIPEKLANPASPPSFFDILGYNGFLSSHIRRIKQKGTDSLSELDRYIVAATQRMYEFSSGTDNPPPHIIPSLAESEEFWQSPVGFACTNKSAATKNNAMNCFVALATAYKTQNQQAFDSALDRFMSAQKSVVPSIALPDPSPELLYNAFNPFLISKILLGLAALLSLVLLFSAHRIVRLVAGGGILAALLLMTAGIILRMSIMHHPPVTNLYETFVFVAWSTVIIGLFVERIGIRPIGLVTASLAGFIFLHIAGRYSADGDTLGMLAAVLDSGFWLTTHIITIALGYAGCMGAGFIAHLYFIQRIVSPQNRKQTSAIASAVYGVFAFGLVFTTLGTVTGGMWADQAWGRFWGWDPKENGALLIVLWSTIVFHARFARRIADIGTAAGAIIASILVMCTWIGVNLLGTGLHSYGFTTSGAKMLFGYSGFEIVFLVAATVALRMKSKK